ncbi:valine--tRNA ligase [Candidatus Dojkabacteria bacterium]|jgi:valyl-tRNA synthetase|nr:valine--tRNA ligase [Candidatus Dojkabacteria bacterium]
MNKKIEEQIPKTYDSSKELDIYELWEKSGYFKPEMVEKYLEDKKIIPKHPFTMTLPPPNANDKLHVGHTCGYSFQDLMGRYNRMNGRPTLLIAGKDHASIQTEAVFSKKLLEQGEDKWKMGREEFFKRCYKYCMDNAQNAREQEKRIGLSTDWEREFFTLDPRLTDTIYSTFFKMFKDGLVYRDKRIINQCPNCKTALADIDTIHVEMRGIFAYIVYPFKEEKDNEKAYKLWGQKGIVVATTRPETMLGDSAVAVNPKDKKYKEFIGHTVILPIANREIPVIADDSVDIENGTGALKVTPAHSPVDWEIGKRNNLEVINVIDSEGKMEGKIPERFIGMKTIDCSKALVKELDELKLLVKIENIKHEIAVCERCQTPIEPIISNQWFIDMSSLAKKAIEVLDNGETKVIPHGQQIALKKFFSEIQPWCISRQLWWGQDIPIWYSGGKELYDWLNNNKDKTISDFEKETGKKAKGNGTVEASVEKPASDLNWEKETDIFDTWFSSGQWTFSTLGGIKGNDFKKYFPTDVMETMRDILFWWVARMMMLGIYVTGKTPFHTVFLHGMILAADGTKMSKSKGNGVMPKDIFDKYGADALRMWYYIDALPGANTPLREEKIKGNRFFVNKIWNASRFVILNIEDSEIENVNEAIAKFEKKESETERTKKNEKYINNVKAYIDNYKFHLGAEEIREFFWHTYCDKWIEEIKEEIKSLEVGDSKRVEKLAELVYLLKENLKIMHPFLPYVTESIWQELAKIGLAQELLIIQQI